MCNRKGRGNIKRNKVSREIDKTNPRCSIDGTLLKEKGKIFSTKPGLQNFSSSNGWLKDFKRRHDIYFKKTAGENKSVDKEWLVFRNLQKTINMIQNFFNQSQNFHELDLDNEDDLKETDYLEYEHDTQSEKIASECGEEFIVDEKVYYLGKNEFVW
ncbi:hypothetical protein WA026_015142 [Henosepilachna vigintioctopunctata]|uniref:HTH CENPB-type domain-containing protein n=1 Tax=Henosepilachna vigintioctopunctata TaxID=420089 RepID=A0AAW1TU03_9CUCU